ncbi:ensconsin-like isoform X11 [Tigriopus californicus]|uniref:ensconsin-like isoform X11 n=1 Tax=Tigriopus californicus TaxID=6832 RepID=UPI0027DA92F1|nr:ensconsin-like isoform X11 [Tigriopus californicus]
MDCYPYPNQRSPLKEIREEGLFHCDPLDEGESVEAEAESGQPSNKCSLPDLVTTSMAASIQQPRNLFDSVVLLDHLPESSGDDDDGDHLFLLPDRVLAMDSISFREDVAAIAPSFLPQQHSPHNSLDSSDSNRSLRLADDSEGLRLARASNGCRTLWLCEAGLIGQTSSNSSSGHLLVDDSPTLTSNKSVPVHEDDIHSQSPTSSPPPPHQLHHHQQQQYHPQQQQQQQVSSQKNEESPPSNSHPQPQPHHLDEDVDLDHSGQSRDDVNTPSSKRPLSRKSSTHRNQTSDLWFMFDSDEQFGGEGRDQLSLSTKEREDRVRKIKEHQEEERRKKLEELKQHAQASQKFREQQEFERRRHFELLRSKENEKLSAVVERRKAIESADRERKEALLKKAIEREEKIMEKRREQQARMTFAFGSSTPRSLHPNLGSSSDIWGSSRRLASSSNGQGNIMSQSMYSPGPTANRKSAERELMDESMKKRTSSVHGLDKSGDGISRESSSVHQSRPPSAMSSDSNTNTNGGVRMRRSHVRRARPISIATTGMSTSMIETRRSTPSRTNQKSLTSSTRMTRSKSIDKDDDNNSTKSTNSLSKSPSSNAVGGTPRRTPAQVKADSNAKKGKTPVKAPSTPMKSPVGKKDFVSSSTSIEERPPKSTTPDLTPKFQTEEVTPDVISGGAIGEGQKSPVKDKSPPPSTADGGQENTADSGPGTPSKKIISSEEEAKAKLAEKRRQMKEKMEREAELERQRLAEEERLEEERRLKEEEEERLAMIEADRLAALARQAEEERLQKAMEEAQKREEEERQRKEEEEKAKKEKEEAERKAREEAEMKQKEMEEKHRKEEAERLERKKRIEQIMARTRGSKGTPTSTPKKEAAAAPDTKSDDLNGTIVNPAESDNENAYQSTSDPRDQTQHHSANADDMSGEQSSSTASATPQPDLLGDLFSNNNKEQSNTLASPTAPSSVFAENEKNQAQDASPNKQLLLDSPEEKGTIDTQIKEVSASNSNGQSHGNGNHEFDQILDLNEAKESSASEVTTAPIIAFENETTNGGQESGAASPLNKLDANTAGMAFIA